jgi:hypothetical protein
MEVKQGAAGEKSPAQRIKFKLEFALLMIGVGRIEEASKMFEQVFKLLEEMD